MILKEKIYKNSFILILFILLGTGVYFNSLHNGFQYDDHRYVTANKSIRTLENIPQFFKNPRLYAADQSPGHYRPLVLVGYALNYAYGKLDPAGYHVINLAFHIASAFLIFLIVKTILGDSKQLSVSSKQLEEKTAYRSLFTADFIAGAAAGIIFLVHPFNSEAVNYITARSSLMSGFFYLLGFWCWVKFRSQKLEARSQQTEARSKKQEARKNLTSNFLLLTSNFLPLTSIFYLGSFFAFIAGMLSKEVVVTLPIMLWLYDLYFKRNPHHVRRIADYVLYLPFLLVVIVPYLLIRLSSFGRVLTPFQRGLKTQFFTELPVLVKYWQMFLVPKGLNLMHDVVINHSMTLFLLISLFFLLIYIAIAIYLFFSRDKKLRLISLLMFWFFIVLLPTTIIPLNAIFQENRGYLALISFAVIVGVIMAMLYRKISKPVVVVGFATLIIMYIVITVQRNIVWGDGILLWKDVIEKSPNTGSAYAALGANYLLNGDAYLSLITLEKGRTVSPENYHIRLNLGIVYQSLSRTDDAISEYKKALELIRNRGDTWNRLATLYLKKGDLKRTEVCIREGMKEWDDYPPLYYNMGRLLVKKNDLTNAAGFFQQAIFKSPLYLQARYELAELYEAAGRINEADQQYVEILRLNSIDAVHDGTFEEDGMEAGLIVEKAQQRLNSRKK